MKQVERQSFYAVGREFRPASFPSLMAGLGMLKGAEEAWAAADLMLGSVATVGW